jgi:predicted membrane channel-forming protein YqfA (hemolysin III family)
MSTIQYLQRVLVMLFAAFPLSLVVMSTIWGEVSSEAAETPWLERVLEVAIFFSVAGAIVSTLLSLVHTWFLSRGIVTRPLGSIALAAALGVGLGLVLSLALPRGAWVSMGSWGLALGLLYGGATLLLNPAGAL